MIKGVGVVLIVPIAMDRAFAANANRSAASLPAEKRESMKPLPNYCLEVNDAVIVVQSCDDERANIGVQWHGKITYCHVALPSLEREWQKWYYNDVRQEIYDMVLRENKSRLLEHIQKLNAVEHRAQWMVGDSPRQLSFV